MAKASKMSGDHGKPLPIFEVDADGQLAPIRHQTWQFPLSGDGKKFEKTGTGQRARADYSKLTVELYDAPLVVTMENLPPDGVRLSSWLEGELLALAYEKNGIVGDELQSRWPYNFRDRDPVTYACPDGAPHKVCVDNVWHYTAFKCTKGLLGREGMLELFKSKYSSAAEFVQACNNIPNKENTFPWMFKKSLDRSPAAKSRLWHLIDGLEVPCLQGPPTFKTFDPDRMAKNKVGALEDRYGQDFLAACSHIFNISDPRNPFRSQLDHWASGGIIGLGPKQPSSTYTFTAPRKGGSGGARFDRLIVPHHSDDCDEVSQSKIPSPSLPASAPTGSPIPSFPSFKSSPVAQSIGRLHSPLHLALASQRGSTAPTPLPSQSSQPPQLQQQVRDLSDKLERISAELTALYWEHGGPQAFPDLAEFAKLAPQNHSEFYYTKLEIATCSGDFSKINDRFEPGPRPEPAIDPLQSVREDFKRIGGKFASLTQGIGSAKEDFNTAFSRLERLESLEADISEDLRALYHKLFGEEEASNEENTDAVTEAVAIPAGPTNTPAPSNNVSPADQAKSMEKLANAPRRSQDLTEQDLVDSDTQRNKRQGSPLGSPTSKRQDRQDKDDNVETLGAQTAGGGIGTTTAGKKWESKFKNLLSNFFEDVRASQRIPAAQLERGKRLQQETMRQIAENEAREYQQNYGDIPSTLRQLAEQLYQEQRDATIDEIQSLGDFPLGPNRKLKTPESLLHAAEELEAELLFHQTELWTFQPTVDRDKIPLDETAYDELVEHITQAKAALDLHEEDKALLILTGPKMRFFLEKSGDEDLVRVGALAFRENCTHDHTMRLLGVFCAALDRAQNCFVSTESDSDIAIKIPVGDDKFKLLLAEHDMKIARVERARIDECREHLKDVRNDKGSGMRFRRRQTIEIIYKILGLPVPTTLGGTAADIDEVGRIIAELCYENIDKQKGLEEALKTLRKEGESTHPRSS